MLVIIVPYRDREAQKDIFIPHMKAFLEKKNIPYKIIICEQSDDERPFNRGAIRNIGFLEARRILENITDDFTYCFHDVDTIPVKDECIYELADRNTIYHPYGVHTCLGGIIFLTGDAIMASNGYPNNYWGWGLEDVCIMARLQVCGLKIDRTNFEWLGDEILFNKISGIENTKVWPKSDIETIKALYYYEAEHRETAMMNGLSNIKYTVLSEDISEENVIHIVVNIDMPCDLETRVFTL
jgi:hypothetical protein